MNTAPHCSQCSNMERMTAKGLNQYECLSCGHRLILRDTPEQTPLDWYAEHAEALKRYTEANPPQIDGIAAVVAALALDGGRRGGRKP